MCQRRFSSVLQRALRSNINGLNFFHALPLLSLFFLAMCSGGCNQKDRLDVAPVRGRVMYRGQGIPHATVIFFPAADADEKAQKLRPMGDTDGEGNFAVKTYVDGDGAPLGKYRVSIMLISAPKSTSGKDKRGEPEVTPSQAVSIPPELSQKYAKAETAGIEVTIEEGENVLPPFELSMGNGPGAQAAAGRSPSSTSLKN